MKVQKVLLCSFHCKPRPSGGSLDSSGLENIAQIRGNRAEFFQNHDARKAVSATLSFLRAASPKYQLDLEIAKKSNFFNLAQNEALRALATKILF